MNINVPNDWAPRIYQMPLWNALENGTRRAVAVWHRRAGKDQVSLNWTVTQAFQRVGLYWHILPTYKQGRRIVWEGMTKTGRPFISAWPEETILRKRDDEMTLWLANGSVWQVVGAETQDDVDKLVGANPIGVVLSEYSLQLPAVWDLIRPILAENDGWALFIYTPRGRNHGYRMFKRAESNKRWFAQVLTCDDTHAITEEAIEHEREDGMPEELVQQEFFCSFDAPLVGAYYGKEMTAARADGRICNVPYDPRLPVLTAWDLGIGDSTTIWFVQQLRTEVRIIDYYWHSGVGLDHYAKILQEKPYAYAEHLVPHDAEVRDLGTGKTRVEILRDLGIRVRVVPKTPKLEDGIASTRALIPRCYFDEKKTEKGVQALQEYTKERMKGETNPDGTPVFRDAPLHNWASHPADGFRTLACGLREPIAKPERLYPKLAIA